MTETIGSNSNTQVSLQNSYANNAVGKDLNTELQRIKDKQGLLGKTWNGVKEITTLGTSVSDCESMLEKYNNGEISQEEAMEMLNKLEKNQDNMSELLANIITGTISIGTTVLAVGSGPVGWVTAAIKGAPIGAVTKATLKTLDRATNNIKGDELNAKEIAKDTISGAITGTTSAVSSGVGAGIKAGKMALSISNGTKCGLACGALSGSSSYLTDCAFGDEEFDSKELLKTTATSSLVSGAVGAGVGAGVFKAFDSKIVSEVTDDIGTFISDSTTSNMRKVGGRAVRDLGSLVKAS